MPDQPLLQNLGAILLAGTAVALLARALRVPTIVAYIVAGLGLGPAFGVVQVTPTTELISEAGIILLLFLVGLELSLGKIREVGLVALGAGALQMLGTGLAVGATAAAFGLDGRDAVFLGIALTFSSTVVVVKVLDQLRELDSRHGRVAVGVLLVQDLAVVLVLTFVAGMGGEEFPNPLGLAANIATAFAGMTLLFAAVAMAAWKLLPFLLGSIARSQAALLVGSLAWCFLVVSAAEGLHLSPELGAFLAGVALAQLPYSRELRRRVHPLMNFFVAVFFVSLGSQMELATAARAWPLVAALAAVTLLLKPPLIAWVVRRLGEARPVALRTGLYLAQTSEFSFILAGFALANGLVGETVLSIVGAVGITTMGASTFLIPQGGRLADRLERWKADPAVRPAPGDRAGSADSPPEARTGHVVVVGMNSLGRRIVQLLCERGEPVLAVDTDLEKLRGLSCPVLLGNAQYLSVLEEAGLRDAQLLVSALHIEEVNRLLAYLASRLGVPCVVHASDLAAERELETLDVAHLLNSREAGVARMTSALCEAGILGGGSR